MMLRFIFLLSIFLTACGGNQSPSSEAITENVLSAPSDTVAGKQLGMNLDLSKLQSVGIAADKIIVVITKGDFTQTIETTHTDYVASVEFSNLIIGEYSIAVQIFDGDTVVAEGAGLGTVTANQVATVNMDLELKSGGLVVNINPESVGEFEFLSIERTMVTTTDRLEGGPLYSPLGSLLVNAYFLEAYDQGVAYTSLEKGSELDVDFEISFNSTDSDELEAASEGINTLAIAHDDLIVVSCSECNVTMEKSSDVLTINYSDVDVLEEVVASTVGVSLEGDLLNPILLQQRLNITITFTKIDGNDIPLTDLKSENLLDESEYQAQLSIKSTNCDLNGCFNFWQLLSN